jgi:hypothetical protein
MVRRAGNAGLLAALALAGLSTTAAAVAAPDVASDRLLFVAGNVEFLLIHELGHLVISEFGVPVFGPEEVAADYIAVAALLRQQQAGGERGDRARAYLFAAAAALNATWERGQDAGADVPYWGAHALNIQRFFQVGCLVYGSDPQAFADLPARIGLPAARAAGCPAEYAQAARSFAWLIDTFGRSPDGPPGEQLAIEFGPTRSRVQQDLLAGLRELGTIEFTVARLNALFPLKSPARLVMRTCGRPEAAWQGATRELVICYELLDTFYQLHARVKPLGPGAGALPPAHGQFAGRAADLLPGW